MSLQQAVKDSVIRVVTGDITDLDVEAFVYYAQPDLQLGAGFGNAITVRGGPGIQAELKEMGPVEAGGAVVSGAGEMKAQHIVHVVGPRFQEETMESKLWSAIRVALRTAEEHGIRQIALPPMGAGFYGVPLEDSARITVGAVQEYLAGETGIREVVLCARDGREFRPFRARLEAPAQAPGREVDG